MDAPFLIAHFSRHRCGTVLFGRVLRRAAVALERETGVPYRFEKVRRDPAKARQCEPGWVCLFAPGAYQGFLELRDRWPGALRASRILRDPRDVVISGYHYHRRTAEAWCRRPSSNLGGRSYQEHLNAVPEAEGILFEMRHSARRTIRALEDWPPEQAGVLTLRFEDVVGDFDRSISGLLEHYGLGAQARERLLPRLRRQDVTRMPEERLRGHRHISGRNPVGKWREHFTPEIKQAFRDLFPGVLVRLGYERSDDW